MKKKPVGRPQKETTRFNKPLIIYLDDSTFEGLRQYCFDNRLKYGTWIRGLVFDRLRAESYLPKGH